MEYEKKTTEELERKITTPEEAVEITRQGRSVDSKKAESSHIEEAKEIDMAIKELLERLYGYDYNSLSPEMQEEYYWVDQEANAGKDRELAKAVLERFLNTLKEKVG